MKMVKLVEKAEYGRIVYDLSSMTHVLQSLATWISCNQTTLLFKNLIMSGWVTASQKEQTNYLLPRGKQGALLRLTSAPQADLSSSG